MFLKKATKEDFQIIIEIVHRTIISVYPNYYPTEVVDFFIGWHNPESIRSDIEKGNVYLLEDNGKIVGTGSITENNFISRLYILPEYQGKGYGRFIMDFLEEAVAGSYDNVFVEASLPSFDYYLNRGYQPKEYHKDEVDNHRVLCYYIMEKMLK